MRDGDMVRVDAVNGTLDALVDAAEWAARDARRGAAAAPSGMGRELFAHVPRRADEAEKGASAMLAGPGCDDCRIARPDDAGQAGRDAWKSSRSISAARTPASRIAEVADGRVVSLGEPVTLKTADHASLQTAWQAFERAARPAPAPRARRSRSPRRSAAT